MYKDNRIEPEKRIDPIEKCQQLEAENAGLRNFIDELKAVREKQKQEVEFLRNECDYKQRNLVLLEAQMEVVRMIFGKGGCNG